MTVKFASVAIDVERETRGDWVDHPDLVGVRLKVCSLKLPAFSTALALLDRRLAQQYKGKPVPEEIRTPELGKLYAKHILQDWDGFDVPYSEDVAMEALSDWGYRNLVYAVTYCASLLAMADVEFVEEARKNSQPPSAGGSKDKREATG